MTYYLTHVPGRGMGVSYLEGIQMCSHCSWVSWPGVIKHGGINYNSGPGDT